MTTTGTVRIVRVSWNWQYDTKTGPSPVLRYSAWVQCMPNFGWSLVEDYGKPGAACVVSCHRSEDAAYDVLREVAEAKQRFPYTDPWYAVEIEYAEQED